MHFFKLRAAVFYSDSLQPTVLVSLIQVRYKSSKYRLQPKILSVLKFVLRIMLYLKSCKQQEMFCVFFFLLLYQCPETHYLHLFFKHTATSTYSNCFHLSAFLIHLFNGTDARLPYGHMQCTDPLPCQTPPSPFVYGRESLSTYFCDCILQNTEKQSLMYLRGGGKGKKERKILLLLLYLSNEKRNPERCIPQDLRCRAAGTPELHESCLAFLFLKTSINTHSM